VTIRLANRSIMPRFTQKKKKSVNIEIYLMAYAQRWTYYTKLGDWSLSKAQGFLKKKKKKSRKKFLNSFFQIFFFFFFFNLTPQIVKAGSTLLIPTVHMDDRDHFGQLTYFKNLQYKFCIPKFCLVQV
jgi:hypothetical protein